MAAARPGWRFGEPRCQLRRSRLGHKVLADTLWPRSVEVRPPSADSRCGGVQLGSMRSASSYAPRTTRQRSAWLESPSSSRCACGRRFRFGPDPRVLWPVQFCFLQLEHMNVQAEQEAVDLHQFVLDSSEYGGGHRPLVSARRPRQSPMTIIPVRVVHGGQAERTVVAGPGRTQLSTSKQPLRGYLRGDEPDGARRQGPSPRREAASPNSGKETQPGELGNWKKVSGPQNERRTAGPDNPSRAPNCPCRAAPPNRRNVPSE